jgi:D-hydroxyproline dehydrogenase subunit beta
MSRAADVVIIGGGIVGAACAFYLADAGVQTLLLERDFPASGTSRACDGLIMLWDKAPPAELELGQRSAGLWADLAINRKLECEYTRSGTILLAEDGAAWDAGSDKAKEMRAAGGRAEVLDGAGLRGLEPHLAGDLAGGVFFPDDAHVDARRATVGMLDAARRRGLVVRSGLPVSAIDRGPGGRVTGVLAGGESIPCGTVVCAAGAWSNEVAGLAGLPQVPIRPRKGHILVTTRVPGLIAHPLLEGGYVSTVQSAGGNLPQVALVAEMTAGGTMLLGSSREFAGFDRGVSQAVIAAIAARAVRFLPALRSVSVIRSYAGLRPWTPDHLPLIGPVEQVPGLYFAAGHEGAGICLAPVTGQLIAGWITGGELPEVAQRVLPDRFLNP